MKDHSGAGGEVRSDSFLSAGRETIGLRAKVEAMVLPLKQIVASSSAWRPINPAFKIYPYESRQRWVRWSAPRFTGHVG